MATKAVEFHDERDDGTEHPQRKAFRVRHSTMKRLRSKTASFADVQNSPTWLRLDAIHDEHVRKVVAGSYWILSDESSQIFGILILLQSISFGVELGLEGENNGTGLLERLGPVLYLLAFVELIFLIVFSIEYSLRSQALGRNYCFAASGVFDAVVLVATLAHTVVYFLEASSANTSNSSLQTARTFRLLRIIRLLQTFPALAMLVKGLFSTFIAILDVMILLTALCYAGALFCCELLGSPQDGNSNNGLFSGVFQGFLTHIQLVLIEAWPDIAAEMMLQSHIWGVYVVGFLLVSNFAVLNVVTGVICERVLLIASNQPPASMEDALENLVQLQERISMLCSDVTRKTPDISKEELLELLQSAQGLEILKAMKIALPQTAEDVTNILDKDHAGAINRDELQQGLMRLRGSSYDLLSLNSHCSVYKTFWSANEALQNAAGRQRRLMRETRRAMTERMAETLPWPRPTQGSQEHSENADLTAITTAMHELRTSLEELQKQCSLHSQGALEFTSNPSIATQTEAHTAPSESASLSVSPIDPVSRTSGTSGLHYLKRPLPPVPSPSIPLKGSDRQAYVSPRSFKMWCWAVSALLMTFAVSDRLEEWAACILPDNFVNTMRLASNYCTGTRQPG